MRWSCSFAVRGDSVVRAASARPSAARRACVRDDGRDAAVGSARQPSLIAGGPAHRLATQRTRAQVRHLAAIHDDDIPPRREPGRPPPYHSAPTRNGRASARSGDHENPASRRDRPKTSDRTWTRLPSLTFPHRSLGRNLSSRWVWEARGAENAAFAEDASHESTRNSPGTPSSCSTSFRPRREAAVARRTARPTRRRW
jgi:hypothetical protein